MFVNYTKFLSHSLRMHAHAHLSVHPDELMRVPLGPARKYNIIQGNTTLLGTCSVSMATVNVISSTKTMMSLPTCYYNIIAILLLTQFKMVSIGKKLWQVEELWYEFLDVGHVGFTSRLPGIRDTVKQTIWKIKMTALQLRYLR